MHPLDNPVWHALTGPQEKVAERRPLAARYSPEIALFSALPDEPDAAAWADLAALGESGAVASLFRAGVVDVPPDWEVLARIPLVQMVDAGVRGEDDPVGVVLGVADVSDMLRLVDLTHPGPFLPRTIELGTYLGMRVDGELVAMAGERMRVDGYVEISGVCTHPAHQGGGLATVLVRRLVSSIRARGDVPMLHAATDNVNAIRLYQALGFELSRMGEVIVLQVPSP